MSATKDRLHKIKKIIMRPEIIVFNICNYDNYQFAPFFSDRFYIKCFYKRYMRKKLNLNNPQTFNEKLQWLKLYNRYSEYTIMADKANGKKFISDKIGHEYLVPTIGVYESVDKVPFSELPDKYVIKCTHDSGSTFICTDKNSFEIDKVKFELSKKLKRNYYWASREPQYKNIKPQIIVEEFLCDEYGHYPLDYKFFCFGGKVRFFKIDFNRFSNHRANYYNRDFVLQDFGEKFLAPDPSIKMDRPEQFDKMVEIAEKLSKDMPFLRVDFYYINKCIYVGELTFFPAGGVGPLTEDGDEIMGELLVLPKKKRK